ncbi:phage tail tape measure protein [Achromobacter sp. 77]|uniref:phage tail tape measure protein n=1 Tax=Achromobacter sp. 77 TaxID=2756133 RepID=UPI001D01AB35|nr:phage tail tape measure protein [Achromobacter sp. 77]UDG74219.1 phage tail tape measure protein [Achromobacter sp. 77]
MAQESIGTARLDIVVDTSQFDTAVASAKRSTSDMAQSAQADYAKLTAAERRRVDSLIHQANTIGMTRKEQILYNAALRGVPTSILDEIKTKLAATGTAAVGATKQINQYGISAAQQAAALRGVPAQITDIVVSLQGGQQPLTVLLQQGGQLKDMFGGIVPAARALGGALLSLINPYTLAAGAAAAVAVAWVKGSSEAENFRDSLILTGNAAGVTAGNLVAMARGLGEITGSHSRAVQALNAVAASGKLSGTALSDVALIAAEMQRAVGTGIESTVEIFAKLGKDPVAAVVDLNERYGILTGSVYAQVLALKEQGRAQEAVELVARQAAVELTGRTSAQKENLGSLESAWNKLGAAASWAWGKMLDIGREESVDEKIRSAEREVRQRAEIIRLAAEGGASISDKEKAGLRNAQSLVDSLKSQKKEAEDAAKAQAEQLKINRDAIQARQEISKLIEEGASKAEKRGKALKDLDDRIAKAQKDGTTLAASDIKAARAAIDRQFEDRSTKKAYTDDAATKLLQQYREAEASLQAQITSEGKLATWGQKRAEFEQQIADLKDKKVLTADQKSLLAQQDLLRRQLDLNVAAEKELRTKQETAKVEALRASLAATRDLEQQQYADQVAGVGLGDRAQEELRARQAILRDYQRQQAQFDRSMASGQVSQETYRSETALLKEHLDLRLSMQQQYFDQVREAQGNWKNGATSALENYQDLAANVAAQTKSLFSNAFQGMEDAIVRFVTTGKLSFKDFATSVVADLTRIAARQAMVGMVGNFAGLLAGAATSGISAGASYQGTGMAALGNTDGMTGWSLSGGRASGGPTAANSLYRVRELGPELYTEGGQTYLMSGENGGYVTPLKNSVTGGAVGSGASYQITNQVIFNDSGRETRQTGQDDEMGREMLRQMEAVAQRVVDRSYRQGGTAWNARNGRA